MAIALGRYLDLTYVQWPREFINLRSHWESAGGVDHLFAQRASRHEWQQQEWQYSLHSSLCRTRCYSDPDYPDKVERVSHSNPPGYGLHPCRRPWQALYCRLHGQSNGLFVTVFVSVPMGHECRHPSPDCSAYAPFKGVVTWEDNRGQEGTTHRHREPDVAQVVDTEGEEVQEMGNSWGFQVLPD